jgi:hypothetical protein
MAILVDVADGNILFSTHSGKFKDSYMPWSFRLTGQHDAEQQQTDETQQDAQK